LTCLRQTAQGRGVFSKITDNSGLVSWVSNDTIGVCPVRDGRIGRAIRLELTEDMQMKNGMSRRTLMQLAAVAGAGLGLPLISAQSVKAEGMRSPTILIRGATLLTMDAELGDIAQGDVLIRDGVIVAVGKGLDEEGAQVLDARGKLMIPGLVDSHWHMWNSILRNAAPTPAGGTFFKVISALSSRFTPELSYAGVRLGLSESINAGITTVNNWAHNIRGPAFADAELRALRESGLRARFWYGYPQDIAPTQNMDFADIERLQGLLGGKSSRLDLGIAIRGPERTAAKIWEEEFRFAKAHNLPVSTHVAVTRKAQQQKAVRQLGQRGLLNAHVQLVHATHVDSEDIRMIADSGATVSLTPLTEMRVGYGLAPVMDLHAANIPISLGIDTLVLSGNANPFMVMQTTFNLATALAENELALTPRQVLYWATQGGANEMGLGSIIGSITPGKRADLVLVDTGSMGMSPLIDPVASIVQSASPADVHTVIADGQILKRDGRLTRIDQSELIRDSAAAYQVLRS
jgi:5-methylthioadenosine/S-adenosylhomocysteine deaminase